jgi:ABC-2 type transport system ATP-binding protein
MPTTSDGESEYGMVVGGEFPNGNTPAVEAAGLVKQYRGRGGTVDAVRGVDLSVGVGEIFGFLGPNGAGKSTTVRMLTTLMSITAGSARVLGIDVAADPDAVRRRIGVALQEAGLDQRQTGRELLILQARMFGGSAAQAATRAGELLELVDLVDAADRRIKGYSGGMKRRLDLASALVHAPAGGLGRGAAHQRAWHDGLPHHSVP